MAEKLNRPFTLAERVYHYTLDGWEDVLADHRLNKHTAYDRKVMENLRSVIDPKFARLRARLQVARRFILTDDLMKSLGYKNISHDNVEAWEAYATINLDHIPSWVEAARLPFPAMWFETQDSMWGYLMTRVDQAGEDPTAYMVSVFYYNPDRDLVSLLTTNILIGRNYLAEANAKPRVVNGTQIFIDPLRPQEREHIVKAWGLMEPLTDAEFLELEDSATVQLDPYTAITLMQHIPALQPQVYEVFERNCEQIIGCIPFFLKLIAAINSPHVTLDLRASKGFYRHRLKNHPFLTSNTITINVAPHRLEKLISGDIEDRFKKRHRAHEVRGFWRHYLNAAACDPSNHDWNASDADLDLHLCSRCAGRRRWIKEHMRGDASLGFVEHAYKVTHSPDT